MEKCGICCMLNAVHICNLCTVDICDKCSSEIFQPILANLIKLCNICSPNYDIYYFYCIYHDDTMIYREFSQSDVKCDMCVDLKRTLEHRKTLPHFKAKPLIEQHFIPVVAQIIFDYYYEPRRYFTDEF